MVLGGLRRCEVLGLRLEDLQPTNRRVFIADGKGGHQRLIPMSAQFFADASANYLRIERPADAATRPVVRGVEGRRRGAAVDGRRSRADRRAPPSTEPGCERATCHQLRHTCLTRLREAGMALEAIQAQAGHRSIESTRVYLHLADDWLAGEYQRASELIDATRRDPASERPSQRSTHRRRRPGPSPRAGMPSIVTRTAVGDHCLALSRSAGRVDAPGDRRRRRQHVACASPGSSSPTYPDLVGVRRCPPRPCRGLQGVLRRPHHRRRQTTGT